MKKWKGKWAEVSRLKKLLVYLTFLLIAAFLIYCAIGSPSFSNEMAFRRQEKAHMVGPGNIIAEFQQKTMFYKDVIVAETEDTYMMCAFRPEDPNNNIFYFYPKTDSMALYHLAGAFMRSNPAEPLTLILFDRKPAAVRAELEMDCPHPTMEGRTIHLFAEAERQHSNFFLFEFYTNEVRGIMETVFQDLQYTCTYYGFYDQSVTVKLYDKQDNLISEETFIAGPSL